MPDSCGDEATSRALLKPSAGLDQNNSVSEHYSNDTHTKYHTTLLSEY
jgi:hypothetical protein